MHAAAPAVPPSPPESVPGPPIPVTGRVAEISIAVVPALVPVPARPRLRTRRRRRSFPWRTRSRYFARSLSRRMSGAAGRCTAPFPGCTCRCTRRRHMPGWCTPPGCPMSRPTCTSARRPPSTASSPDVHDPEHAPPEHDGSAARDGRRPSSRSRHRFARHRSRTGLPSRRGARAGAHAGRARVRARARGPPVARHVARLDARAHALRNPWATDAGGMRRQAARLTDARDRGLPLSVGAARLHAVARALGRAGHALARAGALDAGVGAGGRRRHPCAGRTARLHARPRALGRAGHAHARAGARGARREHAGHRIGPHQVGAA